MTDSYVALDLETTGLSSEKDRILEIGALRVEGGEIVGRMETLVDPGTPVSPQIQALTGITEEMAHSGARPEEAVPELLRFCEGLPLLGHNILFDYRFVKQAALNLGLRFEKHGIDTLRIARALLPNLEHRNLSALCAYYDIRQERAHRAADDAWAAMEVYRRLAAEFPDSPAKLFEPLPLLCRCRKQEPATASQKGYLNDLIKYHKIALEVSPETLTKREASNLINHIISVYGRIRK